MRLESDETEEALTAVSAPSPTCSSGSRSPTPEERPHVSSGGLTPAQRIPVGPSYQVPLARAVKAATTMPTVTVGLITSYEQAEAIVATGDADIVALGRTILYDPRWPWHAAAHLGAKVKPPNQYLRAVPRTRPDLFDSSD